MLRRRGGYVFAIVIMTAAAFFSGEENKRHIFLIYPILALLQGGGGNRPACYSLLRLPMAATGIYNLQIYDISWDLKTIKLVCCLYTAWYLLAKYSNVYDFVSTLPFIFNFYVIIIGDLKFKSVLSH